jgi:regulatory protein YycH of two-component signal transduction system YycFG
MLKTADRNQIERMKSILLVVLTFSTILLLYFFWGNFTPDNWSLIDREEEVETIQIRQILIPDRIILSQGEDAYRILPADQWNPLREGMAEFVGGETLILEEITEEQYQAVMSRPSVRACFDYGIPLSDLAMVSGFEASAVYSNVDWVSEIGYGEASRESLLIRDEVGNQFYRIVTTTEPVRLPEFLKRQQQLDSPAYFQLGTYLGGEISNDTLIPVFLERNLSTFSLNRENLNQNKEELYSVAQAFFGKTFDFVRRIEEGNGTVIYMYGYGQKILISQTNGVMEYKEEPVEAGKETGYAESLQIALNYITGHGAFESISGSIYTPYLKEIKPLSEGKKGYRFHFGLKLEDSPLYISGEDPLIVEIRGGQVVYFRRDISSYDQEELAAGRELQEAYSALNVIAENVDYFIQEMGLSGSFEELADQIQEMEPCYRVIREEDDITGTAHPAWRIDFGGQEGFFDLYTAEPLGHQKIKGE